MRKLINLILYITALLGTQAPANQQKSDLYEKTIKRGDKLLAIGDEEGAINLYVDVLRNINKIDSLQELAADVNDKIGRFYNNYNQNFDLAKDYFEEALRIRENISSTKIWVSFYALASNALRSENYESTLSYLNHFKDFKSIIPESSLIGANYIESIALKEFHRPNYSIELKNSLITNFDEIAQFYLSRNDSIYWAFSLLEKSEVLLLTGDEEKGLQILKSIEKFKPIQSQLRFHTFIADAYEMKKDWQAAMKHSKLIIEMLRKEAYENKIKDIAETTENYRTDKQLDQAEETALIQSQRAKTYGVVVIILLLILAISYLIFLQTIQRKKLENLQAVILGEEQERRRLAKDLHDGIGVLLTSIRMRLSNFEDKVDDQEGYHQSLEQIDKACTEVRRVSHNLSPASLEKLGLEEAILDLADQINLSTDLEMSTKVEWSASKLTTENEVLIYRIVQELINNSLKYAEASKLMLSISDDQEAVKLNYSDNGKGFDKQKIKPGLGLKSIASRLDILKGKMNYSSQLGKGTHFEISIPLNG